jgi:hypothetical protein
MMFKVEPSPPHKTAWLCSSACPSQIISFEHKRLPQCSVLTVLVFINRVYSYSYCYKEPKKKWRASRNNWKLHVCVSLLVHYFTSSLEWEVVKLVVHSEISFHRLVVYFFSVVLFFLP